jgi:hypothetical protein
MIVCFADTYLMTITVLGSLLLPFFFALFYFSASRLRRTPIFICVVLSVASALVYAALEIVLQVCCAHQILFPKLIHCFKFRILVPSPAPIHALVIAIALLQDMANFMADMAVLFRMLAVYPRSTTPLHKQCLIIAPAVMLKVVRLVTTIHLAIDRPGQASNSSLILSHSQRIYMVLARFATVADNT